MIKDPDMDGRCWHGDEQDGKRKVVVFIDEAAPVTQEAWDKLSCKDNPKLYTAADLKAARLETVEMVVALVDQNQWIPGVKQWDEFRAAVNKLKEAL